MKYCERCGITLRCPGELCPFCRGRLQKQDADGGDLIYPPIPLLYQQHELFLKLLILGSAAAGIISVAVNLILSQTGAWSFFVVLGLACFWISFWFALRRRDNIPKDITGQVLIISLISILWDAITGWNGWSIDYVFPILCIIAVISIAALSRLLRLPPGDYLFCLVADIFVGILPVIFFVTGILGNVIASVISMAVSGIVLVSIIIFEGREIWLEITKRFHL